jgi:NAD(P)-dependent dehydrogenase (short-subunit alcohol dehydrogenase family)
MRFADQGALVTGAASGIGEKVAMRSVTKARLRQSRTATRKVPVGLRRRCAGPGDGDARSTRCCEEIAR